MYSERCFRPAVDHVCSFGTTKCLQLKSATQHALVISFHITVWKGREKKKTPPSTLTRVFVLNNIRAVPSHYLFINRAENKTPTLVRTASFSKKNQKNKKAMESWGYFVFFPSLWFASCQAAPGSSNRWPSGGLALAETRWEVGQPLPGSNPWQNSSPLKDNDKAGLASGPTGATANDTAIKPLECVGRLFRANIPMWPPQFSGQMVCVTAWSVFVCVCVLRTCQEGIRDLLNYRLISLTNEK